MTLDTGVDLAPLMEIDRGSFKLTKYFEFSPIGMTFRAKPTLDICADLCEFLRIVDSGRQWAIGDFINGAESLFGEESAQIIDAANLSEASIRVYRWVAAKVAMSNRRVEVSFDHHQAVAALDAKAQAGWLQKAIDGEDGVKWSVARLKREIKNADGGKTLGVESAEYTVTVTCESEADQDALCRQLDNLGRKDTYRAKKPRD